MDQDLGRDLKGWQRYIGRAISQIFAEPLEKGAIILSIAPQFGGVSGEFVYANYVKNPNAEALDDALVDKVWALSVQKAGLASTMWTWSHLCKRFCKRLPRTPISNNS